jgi:RNA polymerase sigma-70 factor
VIIECDDGFAADLRLAASCANGDPAACESFERQFQESIRKVLLGRGATQNEAEDLARSLLSDCVMGQAGRPPLLKLYHGRCSLKNWILTCATNRLIDLKRSDKFRGSLPVFDGETLTDALNSLPAPASARIEPALTDMLRTALVGALAACSPEDRLMLRVVYLEGLTQREVARMWCCHESSVSRKLEDAMQTIADLTMRGVKQKDPWLVLQWEDFLEMCEASQAPLPL